MEDYKIESIGLKYLWNDFETLLINYKEFSLGIGLLQKNELKAAKTFFISNIKKTKDKTQICLYRLLGLIHFLQLEYFESVFYIKKGIEESDKKARHFFLQCLFFVERYGGFYGPYPNIKIKEMFSDKERDLECNFENKYILNRKLSNNYYFQIKFCKNYYTPEEFKNNIQKVKNHFKEYTILCVYLFEGKVQIYDMNIIVELNIDWDEVNNELKKILNENKEVLGRNIKTDEDKKLWWIKRYELDKRIEILIRKVKKRMKLNLKEKVICIFDENTIGFPFEKVFQRVTYRISSLECLFIKEKLAFLDNKIIKNLNNSISNSSNSFQCKKNKNEEKISTNTDLMKIFYLLDAENNLISTQKCISVFINEYLKDMCLEGVCGRQLNKQEIEKLNKSELFMFFGHGSGRKYFNLEKVMPHMAFLFGCSSCKLLSVKNFKYNGHLLNHLNKGRTILGTLWEITDKDLDRFTINFLKDFFKKTSGGSS